MPNFTAEELTTICHNVFQKLNIPAAEAEIVTRSMVDANRVGHDSHGVIHLRKYVRELKAGLIQPGAPTETLHESASIAVLDGNWGFGPVIATRAVELAIEKAKQTDISSVAVSRCNEVGRLGGYACLAVDAEMIGLLMANDHGGGTCVAPHGGVQGRLSTNPIACAVPIKGHNPIVLDMSTSVVASGKIRVKQHENKAVRTVGSLTLKASQRRIQMISTACRLLPYCRSVVSHNTRGSVNIEDENGIPFQIFYGISDNSHKFWSITNAREVIGYAPEDNSAFRFAERLVEVFKEAGTI